MYKKLSKRIGLPVSVVRRGMYNLEHKARGILRPLGLYRLRMERRLEARVNTLLKKQMDYVVRHTGALTVFKQKGVRHINKKALDDEVRDLVRNLPHKREIANSLAQYSGLVMLKAADSNIRKLKLGGFGIAFDLSNRGARDFLGGLVELHLSQRQGSISKTTEEGIVSILTQGVNEGLSYGELAKRIREQGESGVFSRARSELIATNNLAKAYEYGNRAPLKEAKDKGARVRKRWITVGDDKVTEECSQNEDQEWLELDEPHASGDQAPPRGTNPRCRCSEGYDVQAPTGKEMDEDGDGESETVQQEQEQRDAEEAERPKKSQDTLELTDGTLVRSPTGYGYHATSPANVNSIGESGLQPRVSRLDETPKGGDARVYFAVDKVLAGSGLTMDKDGMAFTRVSLSDVGSAHPDPHIPKAGNYAMSFYTKHGHKPQVIEIEDENGKWVPILRYIKDHQ